MHLITTSKRVRALKSRQIRRLTVTKVETCSLCPRGQSDYNGKRINERKSGANKLGEEWGEFFLDILGKPHLNLFRFPKLNSRNIVHNEAIPHGKPFAHHCWHIEWWNFSLLYSCNRLDDIENMNYSVGINFDMVSQEFTQPNLLQGQAIRL
jgi:hypothetical protein